MAKKHCVGHISEIPPQGRKLIKIGSREIGVFNIKGSFFALLNICPHQGASLCSGPICGTNREVDDYRYEYILEGEILRCSRHGWEFKIRDGQCLDDSSKRAKTYPVFVEGEQVMVEV